MMQDHEDFEDLNLFKLKKYVKSWSKAYPCIQRMELFVSNYDCRNEFEFVIVCTVPPNPLLSETDIEAMPKKETFGHQHCLYEYYKWVGDNSSWKHFEEDIPRFYQKQTDLSNRNILKEWRWVTVSHKRDDFNEFVGAWADIEGGAMLLYENVQEIKEALMRECIDIVIKFCNIFKIREGQPPKQSEIRSHIESYLVREEKRLSKNVVLSDAIFRKLYKQIPKEYKRKRGVKDKK